MKVDRDMVTSEKLYRKTDKISVIIPVYNVASLLPRCVDSVLGQTYQNIEIIMVDDGSTDGSKEICDKYAELHDSVRVIHQDNAGVSVARNRGIESATGEYIAFIDSDDWVHCRFLEVLYSGIKETKAHICILEPKKCDKYCKDEEVPTVDFQILNREQFVGISNVRTRVWARLFERRIIGDIKFQAKLKIAEDTAFNLDIYCSRDNLKVSYATAQLYYYYQHSDSVVHSISYTKMLYAGEYYFEQAKKITLSWGKSILLIESLKAFFSARYALMFYNDRETKTHIRRLIRQASTQLAKRQDVLITKRFAYLVFAFLPFTYRIFRIFDDPTMLQWEKNERNKKKGINIKAAN